LSGWGNRARIVSQYGAETLAALLAVDIATKVGAIDLQVAPLAMGAGDPDMA
jgi:hypothetical protein